MRPANLSASSSLGSSIMLSSLFRNLGWGSKNVLHIFHEFFFKVGSVPRVTPTLGPEPMTPRPRAELRSRGRCTTDWATQVFLMNFYQITEFHEFLSNSQIYYYGIYSYIHSGIQTDCQRLQEKAHWNNQVQLEHRYLRLDFNCVKFSQCSNKHRRQVSLYCVKQCIYFLLLRLFFFSHHLLQYKELGVNLNIFACVAPFRRCLKRFLHQDLLSFLFVSLYLRNKVRIDLD